MVEFKPNLFSDFEHQCCWCDEVIPQGQRFARLEPEGPSYNGVGVEIHLDICRRCLDEMTDRAKEVAARIDREVNNSRKELKMASDYGRVFDEGVERGIYTDAQSISVVLFHSSEDDAWFAMLKGMPGLNAFGDTPRAALKEFCVMLPGALDSGLSIEDVSSPLST